MLLEWAQKQTRKPGREVRRLRRFVSQPWLVSVLVGLVVLGLVMLALDWKASLGNALIVAVTTVYATLVFFQLREMEKQRVQQLDIREQDRMELQAQKPKLAILPPLHRYQPQTQNSSGEVMGFGYYMNLELVNTGQLLAKSCQPFLTMIWTRTGPNANWSKLAPWVVPVPLVWAFDEPHVRISGMHTEARDLVPQRRHLFNMIHCNISDPDHLWLLVHQCPVDHPSRLPVGEYCMEVTVYSENALPVAKSYEVRWRGNLREGTEEPAFRDLLQVAEVPHSPDFD